MYNLMVKTWTIKQVPFEKNPVCYKIANLQHGGATHDLVRT